jgi:hypothetical protein
MRRRRLLWEGRLGFDGGWLKTSSSDGHRLGHALFCWNERRSKLRQLARRATGLRFAEARARRGMRLPLPKTRQVGVRHICTREYAPTALLEPLTDEYNTINYYFDLSLLLII